MIYIRMYIWVTAQLGVSKKFHERALGALLRAPMSYFDTTIKGRIENRFANDTQKIDMELRGNLSAFCICIITTCYSIISTAAIAPYILIAIAPLGFVYVGIMQYYRQSVRELQRLKSAGSSPVYATFEEALCGVSSIRAFSAENAMLDRNIEMLAQAATLSLHDKLL